MHRHATSDGELDRAFHNESPSLLQVVANGIASSPVVVFVY
jgi:hypothetical protein